MRLVTEYIPTNLNACTSTSYGDTKIVPPWPVAATLLGHDANGCSHFRGSRQRRACRIRSTLGTRASDLRERGYGLGTGGTGRARASPVVAPVCDARASCTTDLHRPGSVSPHALGAPRRTAGL